MHRSAAANSTYLPPPASYVHWGAPQGPTYRLPVGVWAKAKETPYMKSDGHVVLLGERPGPTGRPVFTEFCLKRGCKNGNGHPETSQKFALDVPANTAAAGENRSTGFYLAKITEVGEAGLKNVP